MNRCKVCGGKLLDNKIYYQARWRDRNIGVDGVPALVCSTCGQSYITQKMATNLKYLEKPMEREEFLKNPVVFMEKENNFLSGDGDRI